MKNIILILTDHFRRDAVNHNTPNINKIAEEGITFTNAYCASPLCQPSRTSLITGLPIWRTNICGNQSEPISDELKKNTFMRALQEVGYFCALIGKHHYIDRYGLGVDVLSDDEEVKSYGFDYVHQVIDDGENAHNSDEYTRYLAKKGLLKKFRESFSNRKAGEFIHPFGAKDSADGYIGEKSVEFIRNYGENAPFYFNVSFIGPHPPYWHPKEFQSDEDLGMLPVMGADATGEVEQIRRHYMAKCKLIDSYAGKLVEALKEKDLYKDTVIIFTSDHGDCLGDFNILDKRFFYESSVGVPLIISGKGIEGQKRGNKNKVSKALVSHLDLYPTILDMAGREKNQENGFGNSIMGIMQDREGGRRDAVFAELATSAMVRTANWKMVYDPKQGGTTFLFNLRGDPHELNNLAGDPGYEKITCDLMGRMLKYRIENTQYVHEKEEQRLLGVHI